MAIISKKTLFTDIGTNDEFNETQEDHNPPHPQLKYIYKKICLIIIGLLRISCT